MGVLKTLADIIETVFNGLVGVAEKAEPNLQQEYINLECEKQGLNKYRSEDAMRLDQINKRQEVIQRQLRDFHNEKAYNQMDRMLNNMRERD